MEDRLAWLLQFLRCPRSKEPLVIDGDRLRSKGGRYEYSLVEGCPVMDPGAHNPSVISKEHISNPIAEVAQQLLRSTTLPALNLSAGGSITRLPHVVEGEYAVFRHTDVVLDVHCLPFADNTFEVIIAMNAFEHYRDPILAAREIYRTLRPGGKVLIHTAFMQPLHEPPYHFYNCTRYGLEEWFQSFEKLHLIVSDNFHPSKSLAWLVSQMHYRLQQVSPEAAERFMNTPVSDIINIWRDPANSSSQLNQDLETLSQEAREEMAAGFEYLGRKPL